MVVGPSARSEVWFFHVLFHMFHCTNTTWSQAVAIPARDGVGIDIIILVLLLYQFSFEIDCILHPNYVHVIEPKKAILKIV